MDGEFFLGDEQINAAILQNVIHLVRLEKIVDRHEHRARAEHAEHGGHEFRTVFEPERDAVAGPDAEFSGQFGRHRAGLRGQRGVTEFAVAPIQGDFFRPFFHRIGKGSGKIHNTRHYGKGSPFRKG